MILLYIIKAHTEKQCEILVFAHHELLMKVEDPNSVFIKRVIHNFNPHPGKGHTQTNNN